MITAVRNLIELNPMYESVSAMFQTLQPVVVKVVPLALKILAQMTLFRLFPNLSIYGLAIGFIFHTHMHEIARKVDVVFESCLYPSEKLALASLGILTVYAKPAALIVAATYYSTQFGAFIYQNSYERLQKYRAAQLCYASISL